jgi:hypothetical protein
MLVHHIDVWHLAKTKLKARIKRSKIGICLLEKIMLALSLKQHHITSSSVKQHSRCLSLSFSPASSVHLHLMKLTSLIDINGDIEIENWNKGSIYKIFQ